jgi:hypothetical protein
MFLRDGMRLSIYLKRRKKESERVTNRQKRYIRRNETKTESERDTKSEDIWTDAKRY